MDPAANGIPLYCICVRQSPRKTYGLSGTLTVYRLASGSELLPGRSSDHEDKLWSRGYCRLSFGLVSRNIRLGRFFGYGALGCDTRSVDPPILSKFSIYDDFDPRALTLEFLELTAFIYRY